jgi:hypothetical protein
MSKRAEFFWTGGTVVVCLGAIYGAMSMLAEYDKVQLANRELVRSLQSSCYPQRVGQGVALIIEGNRLVCQRFDHGIPEDIWKEYLQRRQKKPGREAS